MPHLNLAGATVLITGAAGGIGAASARALRDRGANLVLCDLDPAAVEAQAGELGGERALGVGVDVTRRDQLDDAVAQAVARFGGIDVVFANAGITVDPPASIAAVHERAFERVVEVDLLGVWRTVRAALPQVIERRGHVLVTASCYAFLNGMLNAAYAVSKAGVEQFGRALRSELTPHGATAGVLYPGWIETAIVRSAFDRAATSGRLIERAFPAYLRQPITPEQLAASIVTGIERRSARVVYPRRWIPVSLLRGLVNVVSDARLERDDEVARLLGELPDHAPVTG